MGSTYIRVYLKCIGIRSKHRSALYKGERKEDNHGARRWSLRRTKSYYDFLLKGNKQVEGFVLTLRVL